MPSKIMEHAVPLPISLPLNLAMMIDEVARAKRISRSRYVRECLCAALESQGIKLPENLTKRKVNR